MGKGTSRQAKAVPLLQLQDASCILEGCKQFNTVKEPPPEGLAYEAVKLALSACRAKEAPTRQTKNGQENSKLNELLSLCQLLVGPQRVRRGHRVQQFF